MPLPSSVTRPPRVPGVRFVPASVGGDPSPVRWFELKQVRDGWFFLTIRLRAGVEAASLAGLGVGGVVLRNGGTVMFTDESIRRMLADGSLNVAGDVGDPAGVTIQFMEWSRF